MHVLWTKSYDRFNVDSNTGDLLALPVSSRALVSSARVARKLAFILLNLSLLSDFFRKNLLLPCIQLLSYNPLGLGSHVLPVTSVVHIAVVNAIVYILGRHFTAFSWY